MQDWWDEEKTREKLERYVVPQNIENHSMKHQNIAKILMLEHSAIHINTSIFGATFWIKETLNYLHVYLNGIKMTTRFFFPKQ